MSRIFGNLRIKSLLATLGVVLMMATLATPARAQSTFDNLYPDFFKIPERGRLSVLGFLGGYGSDKYGTVQEGFQLEQSITRYVGLFGRLTGYQLWIGGGFDSPLENCHQMFAVSMCLTERSSAEY